jgi:hypothetical protein
MCLNPFVNTTELKRRVQFEENIAAVHRGMLQITTSCEELPRELTITLDEFLKLMLTSLK